MQANVAVDMFADEDPTRAQTPSKQRYEIMVWLGKFGDAAVPIGYYSGSSHAVSTMGGVDLYVQRCFHVF